MERGYLYGDGRERLRASAGAARARDTHDAGDKPARPREPSAVASPYRTPIAAATFYGKGTSPSAIAAARKRQGSEGGSPRAKHSRVQSSEPPSSDTEPGTPRRTQADDRGADAAPSPTRAKHAAAPTTPAAGAVRRVAADSSPDELDLLPPSKPLHSRMRRKDAPPAPSTQSLTIPLRAFYIGDWYACSPGLELVSFPTHFVVMLGTTECAKIAMRDVFNWMIGGEAHKLFVLVVKQASARTLLQLAPELSGTEGRVQVHFCADVRTEAQRAQWHALLQRVRHTDVRRAQLLPEAGAASLLARLEESAQHAMRLPTPGELPGMLDKASLAASAPSEATGPSEAPAPQDPPAEPRAAPASASPVLTLAPSPRSSPEVEVEEGARRSTRHRPRAEAPSAPVLRYPASGPYAVTILESDLHRLDEDEYLNDTIIEFGLRYFLEQVRQRDERLADQIHLFNSFFFQKMTEFRDRAKSYELVRKWTKGVDVFSKRYLVVPINEHMHWFLAIVVNPAAILQPREPSAVRRSLRSTPEHSPATSDTESRSTPGASPRRRGVPTKIVPGERRPPPPPPEPEPAYVLVLDSLGGAHGPVKTALRDYLRLEARDKQHVPPDTDLRRLGDPVHVDVHVASQPNFCDCGLYLLHNFQCFFSDPQVYMRAALASRRGSSQPDEVWRAGDMRQYRQDWQDLLRRLSAAWHRAPSP